MIPWLADLILALVLGVVAGTLDVLPMIPGMRDGRIPRHSVAFVFAQWVLLGLVIPFVDWDLAPWLKGLLIGELGAVPVLILTHKRNPKALVPTAVVFAVLGAGIGVAGAALIG